MIQGASHKDTAALACSKSPEREVILLSYLDDEGVAGDKADSSARSEPEDHEGGVGSGEESKKSEYRVDDSPENVTADICS